MSNAADMSSQFDLLSNLAATANDLLADIPPLPSPDALPPPPAAHALGAPPSLDAADPAAAALEPTATSLGVSPATAELLARVSDTGSGWDQARSHILSTIVTSDNLPPLPPPRSAGRGRGRPRGGGGRRRGVSSTAAAAPATPAAPGVDPALSNGVGGPPLPTPVTLGKRPRGRPKGSVTRKKRKVEESDDENDNDGSVSDPPSDFDSDDDAVDGYGTTDGSFARTPRTNDSDRSHSRRAAVQTKFGRRVLRPSHFVPVLTSPGTARQGRRGGARRLADAALCKKCERGNSPNNNVVVFCDGCGVAYHQFCHDPPIARDVVDIPEKEWYCLDCSTGGGGPAAPDNLGLIPGLNMSIDEKRNLLESTPVNKLIDIILYLSSQYPHLALFPKDPSSFALSSDLVPAENGVRQGPRREGDDADPPQQYPKPGNGLSSTLPHEANDEPWLVDDNLDAFSHAAYDVAPAPMFASAADIAASALAGMMVNGSSPMPAMANGHAFTGASPDREDIG